jgi:hypothetical protein
VRLQRSVVDDEKDSLTNSQDRIEVGLAGLSLFALGLVASVAPVLAWPLVDETVSVGLLGEDLRVPGLVFLALWPLGVASVAAGLLAMFGREQKPALAAATTWTVVGVLASLAGGTPGLLLIGALMVVALLRGGRSSTTKPTSELPPEDF